MVYSFYINRFKRALNIFLNYFCPFFALKNKIYRRKVLLGEELTLL